MECIITGTPVTLDPKRLVSGPCWNLFESVSHWVLSINVEGRQLPRQQRPDYAVDYKIMATAML